MKVLLLAMVVAVVMASPFSSEEDQCPQMECRMEGEPCGVWGAGFVVEQCEAPLVCVFDSPDSQEGICSRHLPIGAHCLYDSDCSDQSLVSSHAAFCSVLKGNVCVPTSTSVNDTCYESSQCQPPLICDSGSSHRCLDPYILAENETCSMDAVRSSDQIIQLQCKHDLQCSGGLCVPYRKQGEPCGEINDDYYSCDVATTCSNGYCAPWGVMRLNEPCEATVACQQGLVCSHQSWRCVEASLNNSQVRCEDDFGCDEGSVCVCDHRKGDLVCIPHLVVSPSLVDTFIQFKMCLLKNNNNQFKCLPQLQAWQLSDPDFAWNDPHLYCLK